jgi:hypothetical protein
MFPPAEMERLVAGTGWRIDRFIDDGSPRFAVVLVKERRNPTPRTRRRVY